MTSSVEDSLERRAAVLIGENIALMGRLCAAIRRTLLSPDIPFAVTHRPVGALARAVRRVAGELGPLVAAAPGGPCGQATPPPALPLAKNDVQIEAPRRRGAPRGNANRRTHGCRTAACKAARAEIRRLVAEAEAHSTPPGP